MHFRRIFDAEHTTQFRADNNRRCSTYFARACWSMTNTNGNWKATHRYSRTWTAVHRSYAFPLYIFEDYLTRKSTIDQYNAVNRWRKRGIATISIPWVISVRCRHMLPSTTQMARWLSHTAASNVVKASTRRWRRSSHIHWASHTKWSVSKHRITWLLLMDRWRPPQSPARPFVMWEKKLPCLFAWILFIIPIAGSKNRMRNHPHPYGTHSKHSAIGYSMANADASVL